MGKIKRHGLSVRFVHWAVAISTIALIFSGFGQMPVYKRYMIDQLPGLAWTSDFSINLLIHYTAAGVLIFAVAYHIVYHIIRKEFDIWPRKGDFKESYLIIKAMLTKGEEPESDKYLAEQRLAYAYIGVMLIVIIISGIIKVLKNLPSISLEMDTLIWVSTVHNAATILLILGIVGHLAAFVFKANRPLLPGMFTGWVDEDYARRRHGVWYRKIQEDKKTNLQHK
ncbi:formate dehydrogenase gamma subunit [Desulfohalotomaculum tongense]|uniref:formate dehydrogenase subunit gamma n=1 Tax=Desulforadius tongensis TaxID=1216062 RepID=UPI00195D00D9|nr:cytochrome b/b6 domain-containing protein [Desulforadius tongensis]MBM7854587.1 formate dehydrogenase gamma subunit [Desulforadius tongensis]